MPPLRILGAAVAVAFALTVAAVAVADVGRRPIAPPRIFGAPVEDVSHRPAVLHRLRTLPRQPWVRVAFDVDPSRPPVPTPYRSPVAMVAKIGRATRQPVTPPPPHAAFSYQIGGVFPPPPDVGVVDRDRHATPARGVYDICYVNAFQAQPEELGWWRAQHPSLLLQRGGRPVIDAGWNEQLLDTSTARKRRALARIVGGWIDGCARAGYEAVEPDNLDSWTRSHGALIAADNFALARMLIVRAHAAGLAIAQKNAAEFAAKGRRIGFDFAIAEECQAFDECDRYLNAYGDNVIEIEYPDDGGERNFERACRLRGNRISIVYRDRGVTPAGRPGFIERHCP